MFLLQMSQKEHAENDIWEYKPLEKKQKRRESSSVTGTVAKRRCTSRKTSKRETPSSIESSGTGVKVKAVKSCDADAAHVDKGELTSAVTPSASSPADHTLTRDLNVAEGPSSGHFCPICQMPFSILVVQSQRWHVAECLDTPRDTCKGTYIHTFPSSCLITRK